MHAHGFDSAGSIFSGQLDKAYSSKQFNFESYLWENTCHGKTAILHAGHVIACYGDGVLAYKSVYTDSLLLSIVCLQDDRQTPLLPLHNVIHPNQLIHWLEHVKLSFHPASAFDCPFKSEKVKTLFCLLFNFLWKIQ